MFNIANGQTSIMIWIFLMVQLHKTYQPYFQELVTEACHLSSKQLEELMDDDCCNGPVSNGDPMLSSPHLSPNDVMGSSPASSISGAASHYSSNGDDCTNGLSPDSMDLTAA